MSQSINNKPPTWFWVVAILALLWNLMGVLSYLGEAFMTEEAMSALTQEQQDLYAARPAWATAGFAIAVWFGLLGCIALVLRKKWATPLLIISLLGVIVQDIYMVGMSDAMTIMGGPVAWILTIAVIIVAVLLILLSRRGTAEGWLR